jgi:hypothetical protein
MRDLPRHLHLGPGQSLWPQFIWHYSDIRNVASILTTGRIFSRDRIKELGGKAVEIAHLAIIDHSPWAHPYVRLYFRPATPTQYNIEGIRANAGAAHCPVPVFLLFDAASLLTREDCWFSNMNLARMEADIGNDMSFMLRKMNFDDIYHDAPLSESSKRRIIGARCAEVLFKDELDLEDLREVVCRTPGERTTLLHLLGEHANRWRPSIRVVYPGERMFFRDHAYVQEARLIDDQILIEVGGRLSSNHTYTAGIRVIDTGQIINTAGPVTGPRLLLPLPAPAQRVGLHMEFCGCLAYRGVITRGGLLGTS